MKIILLNDVDTSFLNCQLLIDLKPFRRVFVTKSICYKNTIITVLLLFWYNVYFLHFRYNYYKYVLFFILFIFYLCLLLFFLIKFYR